MTSTFLYTSTQEKREAPRDKHPSSPSRRNPRYIAVNLLKPTRTNRNEANLLPTILVSLDFQFELSQSHPPASDKHLCANHPSLFSAFTPGKTGRSQRPDSFSTPYQRGTSQPFQVHFQPQQGMQSRRDASSNLFSSTSRTYLSSTTPWLRKSFRKLQHSMARLIYSSNGTDDEVQVARIDSPDYQKAALVSGKTRAQNERWDPHSRAHLGGLGTLPLEMLFQEQEACQQENTRQIRRQDRHNSQDQTRIPLQSDNDSLRQGDRTFESRRDRRDFSAAYTSSTRAPSGSSRSYGLSERGGQNDYTFSGNTSPLLSASYPYPVESATRPATSDEAIATARRLRSQTSFFRDIDDKQDKDRTIRASRKSGRAYTLDTHHTQPIRRASTKNIPVQSPFPNFKILGRHPSSVVDLEEAAERLSMAGSLEDGIKREYEDMKHNDNQSRRSSMKRSSLMDLVTDIPYGAGSAGEGRHGGEVVFQSPTSFIDPASGGYSPAGAVLTKGRSRADSKCSKTSAYGTRPEPPLEGMPLAQFTGVTSVSRQNSQYSVMSGRDISRAKSIADLETEMANIRRPLAVRNASKDELDGSMGQAMAEHGVKRPITSDSQVDYEQSQQLFEDFDGQHINESPPMEEVVEVPEQMRPLLGKRKSTATLLSLTETKFERPKSYADPLTGQQMVFYPAPVPSMLQLPPKLSQRPNAKERAKRHTHILASAAATRPTHGRNKSAVWLPDVVDEGDDKRKSFMDIDLSGPSQPSGHSHSGSTVPSRPKDGRRNTTQPRLPEHLRANEFFEQMAPPQVVEIKEQSAVKTLDDILDASAHAPVSAFTDHAFAGHLGNEIYGMDHRKTRTKSQLFGSGSGLLDPEGKENKKPVLGQRASSFFGLINKSENALGGDRASTLGILGRGKSPAYDVVGAQSPTLQRDDARDEESEDDEVQGGEPREMDARYEEDLYTGAPTTLLAELQLRKQQAKQRTQPTNLPMGYRTTLLEMDAVKQVQEKDRKGKRVTLAWQDQGVVEREREAESEDEEVPLGMLFPEQARRQQDNAVRPMGLMERRELEDNEPLSKRRERLLGKQPLVRPAVVKRASTMMNFPTNNNSGESITPGASVSQVDLLAGSDKGAFPPARPVSGEFSQELIGRFGTPGPKIEADKEIPEEEETLGQRRKRLIAEKEAREKEVRSGTPDQAERPVIKQRRSMADVLQAHPARTPSPGFQQRPEIGRRQSSQDLLKRPSSQNRLSSMNRLSSTNLAPPQLGSHSRTNSAEFPHLAAIQKERNQKAQIAAMQAEVRAQQDAQHTTMRGLGLLGSQYAGSNLNYQAQQQINTGLGLGSGSQANPNVPLMAGMTGPNGGIMVASPLQSTQSGYFGNKEMVDRMIALRLASQAALNPALRPGQLPQASGGFVPPTQQIMGTGLGMGLNQSVGTGSYGLGSQGPMGGQRGMGTMGLGRGMGPQNQGEWRNQQAQWAHWARLQGLGMGLGGNGIGAGVGTSSGGVDMVEAWRRGVGGTAGGAGGGF